jgi:hypothetical protein
MKTLNEDGLRKLVPYIEASLGVKDKFVIKEGRICLKEDPDIVFTAHITDDLLSEEPVGVVTGTKPPKGSVDVGVGVQDKEVDVKELQKKVQDLSNFAEKVKEKLLKRSDSRDLLKKALGDFSNAITGI